MNFSELAMIQFLIICLYHSSSSLQLKSLCSIEEFRIFDCFEGYNPYKLTVKSRHAVARVVPAACGMA